MSATHESSAHRSAVSHRRHLLVFVGLLMLAALSYALSFVPLGALTVPIALAISTAKVVLVAIFFMELIDQRFGNRFVLIAATVLVGVLIALMVADTLTRGMPPMLTPG
ncbi:MAG: hypothetical protein NVS3B20_09290 [Polyangiales bacterium]